MSTIWRKMVKWLLALTSILTDAAAVLLDDFTELRDANEADDPEVDICPFPA